MYSNVLQLTTVNNVAPNIFWANDESILVTTTNGTWTTTMPITGTTYQWFTSPDGLNWSITPFSGYSADFITYNNVYVKSVVTVGTSIGTESAESNNTLFASDVYKRAVRLLLKGDGLNDAQNNTFLDSSTNNFTITRTGTVTQGSFSPFPLNGAAYNPTVHGGSAYFNGSATLTTPNFTWPVGDFTIETWVNFRTINNDYGVYSPNNQYIFDTGSGNKTRIQIIGGVLQFYINGALIISHTLNPVVGVWYHIAVSRQSNTIRMFVNGVSVGTPATSSATPSAGIIRIGNTLLSSGAYNAFLNGYLSDFRIINGTALYTSNFSVPTAPLTNVTNTSLLLNFTNGGIIDSTAKNDLTTVGNAKVSTSVVKYGTGSIAFDGSSYLTVPQNNLMNFGTQPFTLEGWFYANSYPSDGLSTALMSLGRGAFSNTISSGWALVVGLNSIVFGRWANGSEQTYPVSMAMPVNSWQHYAVVRDSSNNLSIFLNGNIILNTTSTLAFDNVNSDPLCIGIWRSGSTNVNRFFDGYMDDLRITKAAVYTSNFTPGPGALTYP